MTTIRETALAAVGGRVPRGAGTQAQAALAAVTAREQEMFEDLVEAGVGLGASRDQVHRILVDVGMTEPERNVSASGNDDDIRSILDNLVAKVDHALAWARRKGYRG